MKELHVKKSLKMRRVMLLALIGPVLALTGCDGFNSVGVRLDPLPPTVAAPCPHPADVIAGVRGSSVGADEARMGRLGDALIDCGAKKNVAVSAYQSARKVLSPTEKPATE